MRCARQIAAAKDAGIDTVMAQPMIMGLSNFATPRRARTPTLRSSRTRRLPARASRRRCCSASCSACSAPTRWCSRTMADVSATRPEPCRELRARRSADWHGLRPAVPVPAGGMTTDRVGEMLDFYGAEIMLLIGGALLEARERLVEETAAFVAEVEGYRCLVRIADRPATTGPDHPSQRASRLSLGWRRVASLQGGRARAYSRR